MDKANTYRANIIAYFFPCPYWLQRNYLMNGRGRGYIWEKKSIKVSYSSVCVQEPQRFASLRGKWFKPQSQQLVLYASVLPMPSLQTGSKQIIN